VDDVVQETFLVAFRRLDSFKDGRFTTWLYRIAANVVANRHRRRRVRRVLFSLWGGAPEESIVLGPDAELESQDAEKLVGGALEQMAPKKREVFALFEIEGLSGDEIAERVGCSVETVWSRLHYARKEFDRLVRKQVTNQA
jgi:RNA polymerase sigma-70 factor (ECF subfamily)